MPIKVITFNTSNIKENSFESIQKYMVSNYSKMITKEELKHLDAFYYFKPAKVEKIENISDEQREQELTGDDQDKKKRNQHKQLFHRYLTS